MILGVIQVRMDSTRLAGKALKKINGKPSLLYLYERMNFSKLLEKTVIATGEGEKNHPIVEFAKENNIECFAGSEQDLVDRLYQTAKNFNAEIIVRATGDCPLIDYQVIDRMIRFYLENKDRYDFVTNTIKPTYPDGLDVDIIPFKTIERIWHEVKDPFWREWFNSYIIEHTTMFRSANVENKEDLSHLRWTVDYEEDFVFVEHIFRALYSRKKDFTMKDILAFLKKEPQLTRINEKYSRNTAYYEAKKERGKE